MLTRGLSTSGLRVFPPTISRKAPAAILAWLPYLHQSPATPFTVRKSATQRYFTSPCLAFYVTSSHCVLFAPSGRSASPCCEVFFSFILFAVCRQGASHLDFREMLPGVKFCHRAKQPHVKYKKALNIMKILTHSTKTELKTGKKNCKKFH